MTVQPRAGVQMNGVTTCRCCVSTCPSASLHPCEFIKSGARISSWSGSWAHAQQQQKRRRKLFGSDRKNGNGFIQRDDKIRIISFIYCWWAASVLLSQTGGLNGVRTKSLRGPNRSPVLPSSSRRPNCHNKSKKEKKTFLLPCRRFLFLFLPEEKKQVELRIDLLLVYDQQPDRSVVTLALVNSESRIFTAFHIAQGTTVERARLGARIISYAIAEMTCKSFLAERCKSRRCANKSSYPSSTIGVLVQFKSWAVLLINMGITQRERERGRYTIPLSQLAVTFKRHPVFSFTSTRKLRECRDCYTLPWYLCRFCILDFSAIYLFSTWFDTQLFCKVMSRC